MDTHPVNPEGNSTWNAINAGIGNSGNGRWVKFLQDPANKINPSLVVLQVFTNDTRDNISEGLYTISKNGALIEQKVRPKTFYRVANEFVEIVPRLTDLFLFGLIRQTLLSIFQHQHTTPSSKYQQNSIELTAALIGASIRICKSNKWPVILLLAGIPDNRALSKSMIDLAKKENIEIVIVPDKNKRPELYYLIDGHWNMEGHQMAADMLLKEINSRSGLQ